MEIINQNDKIYIKFQSKNKIVKHSLKLDFNAKNLKYATKTLLPIFEKIALSSEFGLNSTNMANKYTKTKNSAKTTQNLAQTTTNKPKFQIQSTQIPSKPHLLSHFCAIYFSQIRIYAKISTIKIATYAINRFFDFSLDLPIKAYRTSHFQDVITAMKRANLSNTTINLIFSYLKSIFKIAINHGAISTNPFSLIKKPINFPKQKHCFTKEQIKLLLNSADSELQTFLYIAFYTGARSGEILALCKDDFDFSADKININKNQTRFCLTTPKNGKSRTINLLQPLKKHILSLNLTNDRLFTKDYFQIYYEFKKLLALLGLPPRGLHATRHSFCSHLLQNGISAPLVAHTLGHSNLDMVNRVYSHFLENKSDLRNLNRAMKL